MEKVSKVIGDKTFYNFRIEEDKYISHLWFEGIESYNDDYYIVERNGLKNFIDSKGYIVSEIWYTDIQYKYNKFNYVYLNTKVNILKENLELYFEEWYDDIIYLENNEDFSFKLVLDNKIQFIKKDFNSFYKDFFKGLSAFNENGIAIIELEEDNFNFINKDGEILFEEGFKKITLFNNLYYIELKDGLFNLANSFADIIYHKPFNSINLYGDLIFAEREGVEYIIDENGSLISPDESLKEVIKENNEMITISSMADKNKEIVNDAEEDSEDEYSEEFDEDEEIIIDMGDYYVPPKIYNDEGFEVIIEE